MKNCSITKLTKPECSCSRCTRQMIAEHAPAEFRKRVSGQIAKRGPAPAAR